MPQLTGIQTGTNQSDVLVGDVNLSNLTESTTGAGILNANINTLDGDDRVEGTSTLLLSDDIDASSEDIELTSYGIQQSLIDTLNVGSGNDAVIGTGRAIGQNRFQDRAAGYGFFSGFATGQDGDDRLIFEGSSRNSGSLKGVGISASAVEGEAGNDEISITGSANDGNTLEVVGAENSSIRGGSGQDTLTISSSTTTEPDRDGVTASRAIAFGANNSFISAGSGSDSVTVSSVASRATTVESTALFDAELLGRSGDDTIRILAEGSASSRNNANGTAKGLAATSGVKGGDGSDLIEIVANASGSSRGGGQATAYSVQDSFVSGGAGDDTLSLRASSKGIGGDAYGASNSTIRGGAGSDTLSFVADISQNGSSNAFGLFQTRVAGGDGNDTIEVSVITSDSAQIGSAASGSVISGGRGDDRITVSGGDGNTFDIEDTIIGGGEGDDIFDVGIGSGSIRGGAGNDTAILDYLNLQDRNSQEITLSLIGGGIRVSGTQNNIGRPVAWSQDIINVEQFQVGDASFSREALADSFAMPQAV